MCCSRKRRRFGPTDTLGSVYFDRLFPMGVEAMMESVDLVKAGKAPRIKQDESKATYEGRCGPDNAHIDWGKSWRQIDPLIRGCNPAPGAWSTSTVSALKIFDATPLPAKDPKGIAGKMGEIVAVEADGFTVVCADGRFKVTRVQPADGQEGRRRRMGDVHQSAHGYEVDLIFAIVLSACRPGRAKREPGPMYSVSVTVVAQGYIAVPDRHFVAVRDDTQSVNIDWISPMPASQHQNPKSDIEISQALRSGRSSTSRARKLGIAPENLDPYGHYKAKVSMDYIKSLKDKPNGKLILVSAITPTPAGEGKTTTTVGLTDALNHIGKKAMLCLREPSLGPSFGVKGGAAGGGYAQVIPMEDINLHFTGDFHAIGAANNLLCALIDNHIYWGNALGIDGRRVMWRRAVDMNDRSLRTDHLVARRCRQWLSARGRLRHHGRLRDHGDLLPRHRS